MKAISFAFGIAALCAWGPAVAGCYGSDAYKTCTDSSGNTYHVQEIGNMTTVQGYSAETGNSWNQTTTKIGNSSYTRGQDADGNSWTQDTQKIGNTTFQSGYDSDGNYYQQSCNEYGCY